MTGLVDGDIACYRCAASAENEPEEIAILRLDTLMKNILSQEENHLTFLTGSNNFRYNINKEYKANRKDKPKPIHLAACHQYLLQEYGAIITEGYEADDALGFNQTEDTVIFSIDKDLLMIPGHHYNFVKNEFTEVLPMEGIKTFYRQLLIGDVTDNIYGVDGIGKVKASRLIDHLETEEEMFKVVREKYNDDERFYMNADCLWIWRKENEKYTDREWLIGQKEE